MFKIQIHDYIDGYGNDEINCQNHCLSAAAGSIRFQYYRWASFLYAFESLWGSFSLLNMDWLAYHNNIYKKIGIYLQAISIADTHKFLNQVINTIKSNSVVIVFLPCACIPWDEEKYQEQSSAMRGIIITGYSERRKLFVLRDTMAVTYSSISMRKGISSNTMWEHCITYVSLFDLIQRSNVYLQTINSIHRYKLYNFRQCEIQPMEDDKDLLEMVLINYGVYKDNKLVKYLNASFDEMIEPKNSITIAANRIDIWGSYKLILRILDEICKTIDDQSLIGMIDTIKHKHLYNIDKLFNIKTVKMLTNKEIDYGKKREMTCKVYEMDNQLFQFIRQLKNFLSK